MSRATQGDAMRRKGFGYGALTRCGAAFQRLLLAGRTAISRPYNPAGAGTPAVWALPRSLATTGGIIVIFSSSGY